MFKLIAAGVALGLLISVLLHHWAVHGHVVDPHDLDCHEVIITALCGFLLGLLL